ncbi:hypothetical protein JZ751_002010 [Albula glossodonta]|uniref:PNT domain-containing protein n=1 Tax=Albula glossodonta TaxID=121402 RepID=A0A8T2P6T6_9TELE|nr:hypothetical protein JZ751_002010 [Albula glossodonta]
MHHVSFQSVSLKVGHQSQVSKRERRRGRGEEWAEGGTAARPLQIGVWWGVFQYCFPTGGVFSSSTPPCPTLPPQTGGKQWDMCPLGPGPGRDGGDIIASPWTFDLALLTSDLGQCPCYSISSVCWWQETGRCSSLRSIWGPLWGPKHGGTSGPPQGHESRDPRQWTENHVREWLTWTVNEFSLKNVDFHKFCMNGASLCALGKERFLDLAPDFVGDILWEHLEMLQKEDTKHFPVNGLNSTFQDSRYTSDYFAMALSMPSACPPQSIQSQASSQNRTRPSTQSAQRTCCHSRKLGGQDSFESIESFESCDRLTQSWSSQSSFSSLQRVPSYDSFDSEDYPSALHGHKPKGTFKDYVRERSDLNKDKPVIPAAALAGYTAVPTLLEQQPVFLRALKSSSSVLLPRRAK